MMSAVFDSIDRAGEWDETLVRRGRFLTTTFLLEADDAAWLIRVVEGRVERVERGPFLMRAWSFAIRAPRESWQRFWEPVPAPGYHDLFAMSRNGHARIEGDLLPLMTHLRYIQDVLSSPRRLHAGADAKPDPPTQAGPGQAAQIHIEPIVGRYMRLTFQDRPHRIYFERSGGHPVVCFTRPGRGRQYRHL